MPALPNTISTAAFFDTKPYDRAYFERAAVLMVLGNAGIIRGSV